ncbi:MAG: UDP-2,3-diacylglucosamine diphosphatase LpxI [Pseudomonadota bacterium]
MDTSDSIAIIACGGRLALECIEEARSRGRLGGVIALEGESIPEVVALADHVLKWGQIGRLISALERSGAKKVLLIGSISRRPDFRTLVGDFETIRWLPRLLTTMAGGDDSVLRKVISFFESGGYQVVSLADVAPGLLAAPGLQAGRQPSGVEREDIEIGFAALNAMADFDIGQSLVIGQGRIAAIEAAEGTDAMLERVAFLREARRVPWKAGTGILIKAAKRQQDLRVDMPVIGPQTVDGCARAGLAGIAISAGSVVIASRSDCINRARDAGLFILSCDQPDLGPDELSAAVSPEKP